MWFRYLIPNMVTIFSMTLGLASIINSINGRVEDACWLILLSVMLDKLDGTLARLLGAESQVGVELDSFADFVAFGLAPAFILVALMGGEGISLSAVHGPAWLYVVCCVLRLARFNAESDTPSSDFFQGVPSTLAGSVVGTTVLVGVAHAGGAPADLVPYLAALLGVLGVLMVSPVYIPKVGRSRGRINRALTGVNMVLVLALILLRIWPEYLCLVALSYLFIGAIVGARHIRSLEQVAP